MRVEVDTRGERMQAKIRDAQMQKVPYMLIAGDREAEAGALSVRLRSGEEPAPPFPWMTLFAWRSKRRPGPLSLLQASP